MFTPRAGFFFALVWQPTIHLLGCSVMPLLGLPLVPEATPSSLLPSVVGIVEVPGCSLFPFVLGAFVNRGIRSRSTPWPEHPGQSAQGCRVVENNNPIPQPFGKRAGDTISHGRYQTDPCRTESWRQHGDAEDPSQPRVLAQTVAGFTKPAEVNNSSHTGNRGGCGRNCGRVFGLARHSCGPSQPWNGSDNTRLRSHARRCDVISVGTDQPGQSQCQDRCTTSVPPAPPGSRAKQRTRNPAARERAPNDRPRSRSPPSRRPGLRCGLLF